MVRGPLRLRPLDLLILRMLAVERGTLLAGWRSKTAEGDERHGSDLPKKVMVQRLQYPHAFVLKLLRDAKQLPLH